jgi:hypothetical protein
MKKKLLVASAIIAFLLGTNCVDAKKVNIDDIDTNTYIIGSRVYELNDYYLTITDVVEAAAEYASNNNGAVAQVYYLYETGDGSKSLLKIIGTKTQKVELEKVFEDGIINATSVNDESYADEDTKDTEIKEVENTTNTELKKVETTKDAELKEVAAKLNTEAKDYGFNSVSYDATKKTATFDIKDTSASLANYEKSGIVDLFLRYVQGATKVVYNYANVSKTLEAAEINTLNENGVIEIAYDILSTLVGKGNKLVLGNVAGQEIKATVTLLMEQKLHIMLNLPIMLIITYKYYRGMELNRKLSFFYLALK